MFYLEMKITAPDKDVLKNTFFWLRDNLVSHDFNHTSSMAGGGGGKEQSTFQLDVHTFSYSPPHTLREKELTDEELKELRSLLRKWKSLRSE